ARGAALAASRGTGTTFPVPSEEEVVAGQTENNGWKKETLAAWGVAWPPAKGWRQELADLREAGQLTHSGIAPNQPPAKKAPLDPEDIVNPVVGLPPNGARAEIDGVLATMAQFAMQSPDVVLREVSSLDARLTELVVRAQRAESADPRWRS